MDEKDLNASPDPLPPSADAAAGGGSESRPVDPAPADEGAQAGSEAPAEPEPLALEPEPVPLPAESIAAPEPPESGSEAPGGPETEPTALEAEAAPEAGGEGETGGEAQESAPSHLPEGVSPEGAVEALLFASTEALSPDRLEKATGLDRATVKAALESLAARLDREERPYGLAKVGRGWRFLTRTGFHPLIANLKGIKRQEGLSKAALETLAVVAYRQPIMRAEIEDIRGVQCGPMLRALLERKLVRIAGRAQVPGRPLLYGTTRLFLDKFGLADLKDLPTLREFKEGKGA